MLIYYRFRESPWRIAPSPHPRHQSPHDPEVSLDSERRAHVPGFGGVIAFHWLTMAASLQGRAPGNIIPIATAVGEPYINGISVNAEVFALLAGATDTLGEVGLKGEWASHIEYVRSIVTGLACRIAMHVLLPSISLRLTNIGYDTARLYAADPARFTQAWKVRLYNAALGVRHVASLEYVRRLSVIAKTSPSL